MLASLASLASLPKTRRYLVGVSGGCDSVVLLRVLHQLGHRKLIVAHFNHRLRGRDSGGDARFVRRLAQQLELDCAVESGDVRRLARQRGLSIEHAAREARYAFFARLSRDWRCPRLLLAHHAGDQAETVLMNLCRGTGLAGLAGMKETSQRQVGSRQLTIIRPLLGVWKSELVTLAEREEWPYRDDGSNADPQFLRNRVRHQALPMLDEVFGRDVQVALTRLAIQAEADNGFLDAQIAEFPLTLELPVRNLRALPLALRRRLLHRWLAWLGVGDLSFDLIERALSLVDPAIVAKTNLPGGRHLRRRQGVLFIDPRS